MRLLWAYVGLKPDRQGFGKCQNRIEKFFLTGSTAGIQATHKKKLRMRLALLHSAQSIDDVNIPGWRLHPLTGKLKGRWAISVSGNWRLTFENDGDMFTVLDYEDYH